MARYYPPAKTIIPEKRSDYIKWRKELNLSDVRAKCYENKTPQPINK